MQTIVLPTDLPTCCEFGGKDLDVLYVTSAVLRVRPRISPARPSPAACSRSTSASRA